MSANSSRPNDPGALDQLSPSEYRELRKKVGSIKHFASGFVGVRLHPYQVEAADAIARSVLARDGESFVLLFARQSGKDELIANLILYLLARLAEIGGSIVCAQPTFRPQTVTAMDRLQSRASQRPFFSLGGFHRTYGFVYEFLSARVTYLSADPSASVVGATADRLLIINEAQDVRPSVYEKRFAPMAASGNATRLFSGTAWTGDTLLDREKRRALQLEQQDGLRRLFVVDGERAAASNPHYAQFLEREMAKLGRGHPLVRTQYFCENIDARSGMFTPAHRALIAAEPLPAAAPPDGPINNLQSTIPNPPQPPTPQGLYAFLIDVAGQEESSMSSRSGTSDALFEPHSNQSRDQTESRDAVTLRIVEIDLSTLETLHAPTYRAVYLRQWTGQNHVAILGQLKALAETWHPQHIVVDATGVGEGLWAMLDKAFPTRVLPVKFTQALKSELGYRFLAIINSGRFRDCCGDHPQPEAGSGITGWVPSRAQIDQEYAACECEILIGPLKTMRWGVPAGRRDLDGHLIHDDIPVTDSLTSLLDELEWHYRFTPYTIQAPDPLDDMSHFRQLSRSSRRYWATGEWDG